MKISKILGVLAISASMSAAAVAEDLYFELINESSSDIVAFHVSHPGDDDWTGNLMPEGYVLPAGNYVGVEIADGEDFCEYDILAEFEDGSSYEEYGADLCDLGEWTFTD